MNETTTTDATATNAAAPPPPAPAQAATPPPAQANAKAAESLSIGRVVHFVMPKHHARSPGAHRPAICVAVNSPSNGNFQVFTDGSNDGEPNQLHKTSVSQGSQKDDGSYPDHTWHWPERT